MDPNELLQRYESLLSIRRPWESLWAEIARYVMPRRSPDFQSSIAPTSEAESRSFDTTAVHANMVLANGCVAWMSPMEGEWFAYSTPAESSEDEELSGWLNKVTKTIRGALARSNFYTAIHEFYLDRSAFGVAALYIEPGKKGPFNCQCWTVGTFVIDEDEEGNVDTVVREFKLTARQAVKKFGKENVPQSVREKFDAGGIPSNESENYLHFILPREDYDQTKRDPKNFPVASIYMHKATKHVCREHGYPEMPVFVSRYLEWGSGSGPLYAWSPSFAALPEARQASFLQKMMDALAEKKAFPPVLAHESLEGEIDPNAAGVTYYSTELGVNAAKEWMVAGDYNVGKDRIAERQRAINEAFHVDLFQMFSQIEKQMTAREVSERSSEKLIQFSPTFARLVTELFNPMLERLFSIALLRGMLGGPDQIPASAQIPISEDQSNVPPPAVEYSSRLAQALRSQPIFALHRVLELAQIIAQSNPEVLDNLDMDKALRMAALLESLPEGVLRPAQEVQKLRQARAEAQAKQQKMIEAQAMADSAAKLGSIKTDSPVGTAMAGAMPQGLPGMGQPAAA